MARVKGLGTPRISILRGTNKPKQKKDVTAGTLGDYAKASKPRKKAVKPTLKRTDYVPDGKELALCIDGSNMIMRSAHSPGLKFLTNSAGQGTGIIYGTLRMLLSEIRTWRPSHVYFVLDVGGSERKKKLFKEYKANRGHGLKTASGQTDLEKRLEEESIRRQIKILEDVLPCLGIRVASIRGIEGDDILAGLTALHPYNVICSTDTDFLQLYNGVTNFVYSPWKREIPPTVDKDLTVVGTPYAIMKSIIGDSTDNIDGIPRVGWKTLAKWMNQFENPPSTMKELKEVCKEHDSPMSSRILDHWKLVERNFKLVSLDEKTINLKGQLAGMLQGWKKKEVPLNMHEAMGLLKSEGIEMNFLLEFFSCMQNLKK